MLKKNGKETIADSSDSRVSTTSTNSETVAVQATHRGFMRMGDVDIECYVLEDGRRVFHKRGIAKAIGLKSEGGSAFLKTMSRKGLGRKISEELRYQIENPIYFNYLNSRRGHAYEADILVNVCKAIKRAYDAGHLSKTQEELYRQANALLHAVGRVGVTALIDEATGYQTSRSPEALRLLVQQYLEEEKREWEKEFPDELYHQLNRIYGNKNIIILKSGAIVLNKPQHFAKFTRTYVYEPLANGAVLEELDKRNPIIDEKGTREHRFHQDLSKDYGLEKLRIQMIEVITILKISNSMDEFKRLFKRRFPRSGDQIDLL